jgi:hypothetical protein
MRVSRASRGLKADSDRLASQVAWEDPTREIEEPGRGLF